MYVHAYKYTHTYTLCTSQVLNEGELRGIDPAQALSNAEFVRTRVWNLWSKSVEEREEHHATYLALEIGRQVPILA